MPTVLISSHGFMDESARCPRMLRDQGFDVRLVSSEDFAGGRATEEESIELLRGATAVVAAGEIYTAKVLASLPDLRVIARLGVGFDKIDIAAATKHGTAVTITPNANHEAVAEQGLALMMAVAKSIVPRHGAMRAGQWPRFPSRPLRGSTLGIVGLGRIGRSLALRAIGLRMKVIATEPAPDQTFVAEHGMELVDLDVLLGRADYVSLNLPLNGETRGFIDRDKLAKFKPGAVLINTCRGGVVVEADLVDALKSGHLGGAGLDVFEQEPADSTNPLFELDNVVLSPHVAGSDTLSHEDMGIEAAQSIIDLSRGKWPEEAVVNRELKARWRW